MSQEARGAHKCHRCRPHDGAGPFRQQGSGELLRSLLAAGLLDRLNLWMYPIALGTGKRLFDTGTVPTTFAYLRSGA